MIAALGCLALMWSTGDEPSAVGQARAPLPAAKPGVIDPEPREIWELTLGDAVAIGLNNSEIVRLISLGPRGIPVSGCFEPPLEVSFESDPDNNGSQIVISRLDADMSPWQFKAEVMALLRSIEQRYRGLSRSQQELWARKKAIELACMILKREQAKLESGRGSRANVTKVKERLKQFTLDVITKTSEVATVERQLRELLGVPLVDDRRIVVVTVATIKKIDPCRAECLASMTVRHPELVHQTERVRQLGRLAAILAYPAAFSRTPIARDVSAFVERRLTTIAATQQERLKEVQHRTTRSLDRVLHEIDVTYKNLQAASATKRHAEEQVVTKCQLYDEEGRISVDQSLDAISMYVLAVAEKARTKSAYNDAIAALEEARGTLLITRDVEVRDYPRKVRYITQSDAIKPTSVQARAEIR